MTSSLAEISSSAAADAAAARAALVRSFRRLHPPKQQQPQQQQQQQQQKNLQKRCQPDSVSRQPRQSGACSLPQGELWLNQSRRRASCKRHNVRRGEVQTSQAASDDRVSRASSVLIPLDANNSAKQAKKSPQPAAAPAAQPVETGPLDGSEGSLAEADRLADEKPVTENQKLALSNAMTRRLRQSLDPPLKSLRSATLEDNLNLVKLRRHPTQLIREVELLETQGVSRPEQILAKHRQQRYLSQARKNSRKRSKGRTGELAGQGGSKEDYPDWINFKFRIRRSGANELWNNFIMSRRKSSKHLGEKALNVVKPSERYHESYIDVWTHSLTVQVRSHSLLRDVLRPVQSRLGLENRADVRVTIGCFAEDIRQGGDRTQGAPKNAVDVALLTPLVTLFEAGITELFATPWPGFKSGFPKGYFDVVPMHPSHDDGQQPGADKNSNNQSNLQLVRQHLMQSQQATSLREQLRSDCKALLPILMESAYGSGL